MVFVVSSSLSGSTVSFAAVGTCVITASQTGNAGYNAATPVTQTVTVGKGTQTVAITSTPPPGVKVGGPTYTVAAVASSGATPVFSIDPSATAVCSSSGPTVSFAGPGICVVNASQAGNVNWFAAPPVQQSFGVNQAPLLTSASSASFTASLPGAFTVTTAGLPTGALMAISMAGQLPVGVTFVNNYDGTATLAGTPDAGTEGAYPILITANNAVAPNATQGFTLTVF